VTVRRFPVVPSDVAAFDRANGELLEMNERPKAPGTCRPGMAARAFVDEKYPRSQAARLPGPRSAGLWRGGVRPYLYGPILRGVEQARGQAVCSRCCTTMTYAYLPQVDDLPLPRSRILFNSRGRSAAGRRLYGLRCGGRRDHR